MVNIIFHLEVKPGKKLEFMQSIGSLIIELRRLEGCIGIDIKQDPNDEVRFSLALNGDNQKFIQKLLSSAEYNFLEGAIRVLCNTPTIEVTIGNKTTRIEPDKKGNISLKNQIISKLENNLQL
jgi:quinol monooxygenase YgiN